MGQITSVGGIRVGHAHSEEARTGVSVVLFDSDFPVAYEARGGWPGTYDTDSISVAKTFIRKHAIFLTGGDVFGFDCAIGIRNFLVEQGVCAKQGAGKLPGIVGANIYDLEYADISKANFVKLGYEACRNASSGPVKEGSVGAGRGATVGKFRGMTYASKGGLGSSSLELPYNIRVGAIVVTNSVGNIVDYRTGMVVTGSRLNDGAYALFEEHVEEYLGRGLRSTTIGVVATNVQLTHEELIKVAQLAHDGLAMSVRPAHLTTDGDTIFAVSTGRERPPVESRFIVDSVGYAASICIAEAVLRSVKTSG
ncbi:MAG: P1 family peptidase [Thermoprotei archaeon]